MKTKITIVLPVEIKKREFHSRLVLAYYFSKEGYTVIIGDRSGCKRETRNLQNCIYIAKSLAFNQRKLFENYRKNNGKILILFEEGAYTARKKNKFLEIKFSYPKAMLSYIDSILVYGKSFQKLLIENVAELNIQNTFISGNSRFDLHKPKYHPYFMTDINKIKNEYGKYILIIGNFVAGNHYLGQDAIRKEIINTKEMTDEMKVNYFEKMIRIKKNLEKYLEMIKNVAMEFTSYSLIVRPHPAEDKKIYFKNLSQLKNVYITNDGAATSWIIGSEIVIHQDCTTAIEAIFAQKPVISYVPFEDNSDLFWLSTFVSDIANNEPEMISKIREYLNGKKFILNAEQESILNNEVVNSSKETSDLMIDIIKKIVISMNNTNSGNGVKENILIAYLKRFCSRFIRRLRWLKGKSKKSGYTIKFEGLNKKEVKDKIEKIKKIDLDSFIEVDIKKCGINTFKIENRISN